MIKHLVPFHIYIFGDRCELSGQSSWLWGGPSISTSHTTKYRKLWLDGLKHPSYNWINLQPYLTELNKPSIPGAFTISDQEPGRFRVAQKALSLLLLTFQMRK